MSHAINPRSFVSLSPPRDTLTPRALERRLKRYFLKETHTFAASCNPSFTPILAGEIREALAPEVQESFHGGVEFCGPLPLGLRANLLLRTAQRIQLRIASFYCNSYPELFQKCGRVAWELFLGREPEYSLHVTSTRSRLHQTERIADTIVSAISEYYRRFASQATQTGDGVRLTIRFFQDEVTLGLDLSGEHLHRRGRKTFSVDAPLRETLAAGLLLWKGIEEYPRIIDPCCGSGTFLLEAADILTRLAPGRSRSFALERLSWFQTGPWQRLKSAGKPRPGSWCLIGRDIDESAVRACQQNFRQWQDETGFDNLSVAQSDARNLEELQGERGLIISNLPYGKRITTSGGLEQFYEEFGRSLLRSFAGWDVLLVSSRRDLLRRLPLRETRSLTFRHGGLPVEALAGRIPDRQH